MRNLLVFHPIKDKNVFKSDLPDEFKILRKSLKNLRKIRINN